LHDRDYGNCDLRKLNTRVKCLWWWDGYLTRVTCTYITTYHGLLLYRTKVNHTIIFSWVTNIYVIEKHNQFDVWSQMRILFFHLSGSRKFCLITCVAPNYIKYIVLIYCVSHLNKFDFGWLCIEIFFLWRRKPAMYETICLDQKWSNVAIRFRCDRCSSKFLQPVCSIPALFPTLPSSTPIWIRPYFQFPIRAYIHPLACSPKQSFSGS
jgi:hypothetical protein